MTREDQFVPFSAACKRFLRNSAARALRVPLLAAILLASVAAPAQLLQQLTNGQAPTPPAQQDPLGRDTPSGTVFGFLQAAQSYNYVAAVQYLQLPAGKHQAQLEELATQLKEVLDQAYKGSVRRISNSPDGNPQEGLTPDRQDLGTLVAGDVEANLTLVRVTDEDGVKVWLFSAETLAHVPELYDQLEVHQVETKLPKFLAGHEFTGLALWQWLAILLAIPISIGIGWILTRLLDIPRHIYLRVRKQTGSTLWAAVAKPLWMVLSVWTHWMLIIRLRLPLLPRHYYVITAGIFFITAISWLIWRLLQQILRRLRQRAIYSGRTGTGSLMLLGERMLKAAIFVIAVLAILSTLGFNMSTALAGLGIGGIAVAFAAQKTLENLFGGVSILGDEVIRVGDMIKVGDRQGTVEDISLRSTRIRTLDRTELSIPNGALATANIENLSRRDKMLFNTKLGLRCETSADQLRYVLAEIRRLLYEHPKVETDGARARFVSFDASALTLEINCFILTTRTPEFSAIQEDLLLWIMDIVEASGTGFAFPSQTVYLGQDTGLNKEKAAEAEKKVREWRAAGKLPFPDFAADEIFEISNSLAYPRPEAAVRKPK